MLPKSLLLSSLLIFSQASAFASTELCTGHELLVGDQGQTGQVEFDLDAMSAQWQGASLFSGSSLCGMNVTADQCETLDLSMSLTPTKQVFCANASAEIIFSEATLNGRLECSSANAKHVIEFSHCQPKN